MDVVGYALAKTVSPSIKKTNQGWTLGLTRIPQNYNNRATATKLNNGMVAVLGQSSAEPNFYVFDVTTNTWTQKTNHPSLDSYNFMELLPDGKLFAFNQYYAGATWDYNTNVWTPCGAGAMAVIPTKLRWQNISRLPNGLLFVTGFDGSATYNCYTYDQPGNVWTSKAMSGVYIREYSAQSALPNNDVLVTGGYNGTQSYYKYTYATNTWSAQLSMGNAASWQNHRQVTMPDGKVWLFGGSPSNSVSAAVRIFYDYATGTADTGSTQNVLNTIPDGGRADFGIAVLDGGDVLLAGGSMRNSANNTVTALSPLLFDPGRTITLKNIDTLTSYLATKG